MGRQSGQISMDKMWAENMISQPTFLIPDGGERVDTVSEPCYIVCADTESECAQDGSRNRHFWTSNKESCYEGKRVFYQRDHPGKGR